MIGRTRFAIVLLLAALLLSSCSASGREAPEPSTQTAASASQQNPKMSASASCPSGERMVGGGFFATSVFENQAFFSASYPSGPNTWSVLGVQATLEFQANAAVECRPANIPLGVRIVRETFAHDGTVVCPAGTELLGGGFRGAIVEGSYPVGNGWRVTLGSGSDSSGVFDAYALCASQHVTPGSIATTTFNPHSTANGYLSGSGNAMCPAGQVAIGGGFDSGDTVVTNQADTLTPRAWTVTAGGDNDTTVYAVCVTIT
jgi:hypothetical protein